MNDVTPPSERELHIVKECSEYTGEAGSFCTITSSDLDGIPIGAKVVYAQAAGPETIDSDLSVVFGGDQVASGHVLYDLATDRGSLILTGDSDMLKGFRADIVVTSVGDISHWDGTYAVAPTSSGASS